jgi:hypothetical protein
LVITSGVTGRRGSRGSAASAASRGSTCGRRHVGRDAAQAEEDVNDSEIDHRSAVLLSDHRFVAKSFRLHLDTAAMNLLVWLRRFIAKPLAVPDAPGRDGSAD